MIFAIVFDSELSSVSRIGFVELPSRSPTGLISRFAKLDLTKTWRCSFPVSSYNIFQDVYVTSLYMNRIKINPTYGESVRLILEKWRFLRQKYLETYAVETSINFPVNCEDTLYKCVHLAVILFFSLVDGNINDQSSTATRSRLINDLRLALTGTEDIVWLKAAPEAYSWVCLTGAAASEDSRMRGWFYFRQGSMARALNVDDASLVQDAWSYFYWLRQIARRLLLCTICPA
jgi:hypothetical protein